jgi:hypothetical protein
MDPLSIDFRFSIELVAAGNNIPFTADGYFLMACPDTGSDLGFISKECAIRCDFEINASDVVRRCIVLGDTSIVETIGEVQIESLGLKYHDGFAHTFHVLRGLPCDTTFGEELLEKSMPSILARSLLATRSHRSANSMDSVI